jgi:hypothetical protein
VNLESHSDSIGELEVRVLAGILDQPHEVARPALGTLRSSFSMMSRQLI